MLSIRSNCASACVWLIVAILLSVAAWLAHRPPFGSVETIVEAESDSLEWYLFVHWNLFIRLAVPWIMQFAAVALPAAFVARRFFHARLGVVAMGASLPLVWGLFWWGHFAAPVWIMEPLTRLTDKVFAAFGASVYQAVFWHLGFLEVAGPSLNPFQLSGPWSLIGWDFLWCGASSLLVVCYWIAAAQWIGVGMSDHRFPSSLRYGRMIVAVLIWTSPMLIRLMLDGI